MRITVFPLRLCQMTHHFVFRIIEVIRICLEDHETSRLYSKTMEDVPYPGDLFTTIDGGLVSHQCNLEFYHLERPSMLTIIDFVSEQVIFAEASRVSENRIHKTPCILSTIDIQRRKSSENTSSYRVAPITIRKHLS